MSVKTLDFSKFVNGSSLEREALAKELIKCFQESGFVKFVNHGVPEKTVQDFQTVAKQMFDLPIESKAQFGNVAGPYPQRGWSCKGAEQTSLLREENVRGRDGKDLLDEREFYDAGPPDDKMFPNKWPGEKLPRFQPIMEACFRIFHEICFQVMQALEIGLDLPQDTLADRCKPAASEFRLNHYPEVEVAKLNNSLKRTWPHTDFGIITLLFQDNTGGLELEDRQNPGSFTPVAPSGPNGPSEMVVNIADTFQRWTNDAIRAGVHRVETPPALKNKRDGVCPDRYSCAFFFKADRNMSAGPLPHFVTAEQPAKYDEITALEFQQRMTRKLYIEKDPSILNKDGPTKAGMCREVEV